MQKCDVVISLKGRDSGKHFLVLDADDTFLYLANGKDRRVESPKKKKLKHTQFVYHSAHLCAMKLLETGKITNSDVRKVLAECKNV